MKKLLFPIIVMEEGIELPDEGTYYVVAKDGIYLRKDNGLFCSLVKVDGISSLDKPRPYVKPNIPKLPADVIYRAHRFFAMVFERYRAEAALVIHFNSADKTYFIHCPEQIVSGIVAYNIEDRFESCQLVGTIHSHMDGPAGHSGTDIHDERNQDGLHITLGHVNSPHFSASCTIAINGARAELSLENCAQGVEPIIHQHVAHVGNNDSARIVIDQTRYRTTGRADLDVNWMGQVWPAEGLDLHSQNDKGNLLWARGLVR